MFEKMETSELIRFINSWRHDNTKKENKQYQSALHELEQRSELLARVYKLDEN